MVPFFDEVKLSRVLTDRGTEYCGNPEHHEYELYLAVEDVDHSRTKTKNPQTNGIVFFTWAGFDETDEVTGDGSAELLVTFAYHNGDEAILKAKRAPSSTAY
ncbi:hypothetical protein MesoLjLa_59630 [Mesorhizobium sp. L-2-11]|nr:hypothetical protein MesoLjLa_59630 [Mesorhizobium sp. L-2-11]